MADKVKSTIYIDGSVLKQFKKLAIDKEVSLSELMEQALREKLRTMDRPEWLIDNYYCPGCGMAISPKEERPEKSDVAASYLFTFTCDCCGGRFEILDRLCGKGRRSDLEENNR